MLGLYMIDTIDLNNEELEPALISLKDDLQSAVMAYLFLDNAMEELGDALSLSFLKRFVESSLGDEVSREKITKLEQFFLKDALNKAIILLMGLSSKTEVLINALSMRRDGDTSINEEKLMEIFVDFKEILKEVIVLTWAGPDLF